MKAGFTLVEILIVVVILGILAAIVIPQFTEASTEAKTSSLCTDLQSVRSQIELYKIQHNDNLPGVANGTHLGTAGFAASMTGQTTIFGVVGTDYGPYLQKMPLNQFNNLDTVQIEAGQAGLGGGSHGWHFDTSTGAFHADTDLHVAL